MFIGVKLFPQVSAQCKEQVNAENQDLQWLTQTTYTSIISYTSYVTVEIDLKK